MLFNMADEASKERDGGRSHVRRWDCSTAEKRKSSEHGDVPEKKKMGFSISMKKPGTLENDVAKKNLAPAPIKMSLGTLPKQKEAPKPLKQPSLAVAAAFNQSDESDEEEMPPEAKMRMKNIGRNTPTAAGPNSFGKGRLGFCDRQRIIQREIQKEIDEGDTPAPVQK